MACQSLAVACSSLNSHLLFVSSSNCPNTPVHSCSLFVWDIPGWNLVPRLVILTDAYVVSRVLFLCIWHTLIFVAVVFFLFSLALLYVLYVKAPLHGSPRLINTVESMKLNSTVERYCLHGSTKVNEAVDFKMAANELVREAVVVICDYLIKECQHILEKRNKWKKTTLMG